MSAKPIIIYKKRRQAAIPPYRGGMWKVAYADFITAMMAFFLLLWLLSVTPENTLKGIADYFTSAKSSSDKVGIGLEGGADSNVNEGIGAANSASSSLIYGSPSRGKKIEQADKSHLMSDIEKEHFLAIMNNIQRNMELKEFVDNINIDITNEGLRIQVMDSENRPMFKPNTADLQPYMRKILSTIGKLIKNQPNYISISGHTASIKQSESDSFDYWGISAQRANEVRKFLTAGLLKEEQIIKVVGIADKEPFDINDKYGVRNIRIAITLLNNSSVPRFHQSAPDKIFQK